MRLLKDIRILGACLAAGMLFSAGGVSAQPLCSSVATTSAWQALGSTGCLDNDQDVLLRFGSFSGNFPTDTGFSVTETELNGKDNYDVGFTLPGGDYTGGGDVTYSVTSVNPLETLTSAALDSIVIGTNPTVTTTLSDTPNNNVDSVNGGGFLTMTSMGGVPDPTNGGEHTFNGRMTIYAHSVLDATSNGGTYQRFNNTYNATISAISAIPEPETIMLFASGLAGLAFARRKDLKR